MTTYWKGTYLYPTIEMNWYNYKEIAGYVYSVDDIIRLQNIHKNETLNLKTLITYTERTDFYKENSFLISLKSEINEGKNVEYYSSIFFKRTSSVGKDVIRFRLPFYYSDRGSNEFEKAYYEIPKIVFDNLFKIRVGKIIKNMPGFSRIVEKQQ